MTERESFLKSIRANPYDEAAHRVYADWLEENGLDDEAAEQRRWTPRWQEAHDWLLKFCENCGAGLQEMREAVERFLKTGDEEQIGTDWLGFDATNQFVDSGFRESFWEHWEEWTRSRVDDNTKRREPFGCCI